MGLVRTVDPATEPVSLTEAKDHLRVEFADDDTLISSLIGTARMYCERWHHRAYITQSFKLTLDCFPSKRSIVLLRPPIQSVSSITYYDQNGVQQTLDSSKYSVDTVSEPGRVCLAPGESDWPSTQADRKGDTVEITFVAGYGDPEDVPQDIRTAVLMMLGHLYENREASSVVLLSKVPFSVDAILSHHRWGCYQ